MIRAHLAAELRIDGERWPVFVWTVDHPAGLVLVDSEGSVVLGGDVGTSFRELGSGTTEGQRRVLALGAPTWLSHAAEPTIPEHRPDSSPRPV